MILQNIMIPLTVMAALRWLRSTILEFILGRILDRTQNASLRYFVSCPVFWNWKTETILKCNQEFGAPVIQINNRQMIRKSITVQTESVDLNELVYKWAENVCATCKRLPSNSSGIVDVFTGRYQAKHVPSRYRCIATVLHITLC
jgi:hypothetical protein